MPIWPAMPCIAARKTQPGNAFHLRSRWSRPPFVTPMSSPATPTVTRSVPLTRATTKAPAPQKRRKPYPTLNGLRNTRRLSLKYCRFIFEGKIHYGAVEDRVGEPWIIDLTSAPEEDLAF